VCSSDLNFFCKQVKPPTTFLNRAYFIYKGFAEGWRFV
jgi:hypothetical protein